ncbi:MAG TPA: (2Fe-2S)-binding protein [Verrucomicrobiales bacterium]|nr:(2Fe-2S)-binding protein [Verrucomicrobiales bacterium]
MHTDPATTANDPPRRNFFKQVVTGALTAVVGVVPGLAGLMVIFDPLRRREQASGDALPVTRLGSLPADGVPRRFRVYADRRDAWNTYKQIPIGAVFLRRTEDGSITALNAACPHAGCSVGFSDKNGGYLCPCHDSEFTVEGKIAVASSPSPRALDALEVEVRDNEEVWVKFMNFQPGHKERHPVA